MQVCHIDETGIGMNIAERLEQAYGSMVERVYFTAQARSRLATPARTAIQSHEVMLPSSETILEDFKAVQKILSREGNIKIISPRTESGHSDYWWAFTLAYRGFRTRDSYEIAVCSGDPF